MKRVEKSGLVFYQSKLLLKEKAMCAFFTRKGGVSKGEFSALNLSFRVGDDTKKVEKNHELARAALGVDFIACLNQVHGAKLVDADNEPADFERFRGLEADGLLTRKRGFGVAVLVADCYPVVLLEKERRILSVVHCGWRGTAGGIIENAVGAIVERGGKAENIVCAIGPGVCGKCYTVSLDVVSQFEKRLPNSRGEVWEQAGESYRLDLCAAIRGICRNCGIEGDRIDELGLCTSCDKEFFSHRRDHGKSGRQMAVAFLR